MSKTNSVPGEGWVHKGVLSNEMRLGCQHCCLAGCRCSPGCALATKLDKEGEGINGSKQLQGVKGLKGLSDMAEAIGFIIGL